MNWRRGHVELRIRGEFFGFWPDHRMRHRISGTDIGREDSPLFGGFAGDFTTRTRIGLLGYYSNLWIQECLAYEKGKKDPNEVQLPSFCVCEFSVDKSKAGQVRSFLLKSRKNKIEYHIKAAGSGDNCVTLSVRALQAGAILDTNIYLDDNPSPHRLSDLFMELAKQRDDMICYMIDLDPPGFDIRERADKKN